MLRRKFLALFGTSTLLLKQYPILGTLQIQTTDLGQAIDTSIDGPRGLAIDTAGMRLFIAERLGGRVLCLDLATGKIRRVLGIGRGRFDVVSGARASQARVRSPVELATSPSGSLWVADGAACALIEVDHEGDRIIRVIELKSGNSMNVPAGLVVARNGDLFIAAVNTPVGSNDSILHLDGKSNRLSRLVGANAAIKIDRELSSPQGIAVDARQNLYIADQDNNRILVCDYVKGHIAPLIDSGQDREHAAQIFKRFPSTGVYRPRSLALSNGNLYFTEAASWVRVIDLVTKSIRVVAGNQDPGVVGDGGLASSARLMAPWNITVDRQGNIFIADWYDNRVRQVDQKRKFISTVAGNGLPKRIDINTLSRQPDL